MKILYLHHGSALGGAPLSLLYLLQAMDPAVVDPIVCSVINDAGVLDLFATHGYATCATTLMPFTHTTGQRYAYANPRDWLRLLEWVGDYRQGCARLHELLEIIQPEVVHFNSIVLAPYLPVAHALGIPTVLHVRESVLPGIFGVRKAWLERLLARYADAVVVICRDNLHTLRLAAGKATVIYEPLDFTKFDYRLAQPDARAQLGIAPDAHVVLFAGGSVPEIKGLWEYLHAMQHLRLTDPRLVCLMPSFSPPTLIPAPRLSLLGRLHPGRRRAQALRDFLTESGLTSQIKGFPFRFDIERFIAASDVVCVPHIQPHFSRTVVEAHAMRKPVAAFCIGGIEEVVAHNESGLLVPVGDVRGLADAVQRLLADPALGRQLGDAGYRQIHDTFSATRCARVMEDIYRSLLHE